MRWTFLIVVSLAIVASSKFADKKNSLSRMVKNVLDWEDELENQWSDDGFDDSEEDEDFWRSPKKQHHQPMRRVKPAQKKHCERCGEEKYAAFDDEDDEEKFENQWTDDFPPKKGKKQLESHDFDDDFPPKKGKKQLEFQDFDEEPNEKCKADYALLRHIEQINAQLAARLLQESKQIDDDRNTVASPIAAQLMLVSISEGARGNTKHQIGRLLESGVSKNQCRNAYAALVKSLKGQGPNQPGGKSAQITSITSVIVNQQSAHEQFIDSLRNCFDSEVKKCDFRQQPQKCRDQINQWLSSKTGQKSRSALSQYAVTANTKMISIGTTQLIANWGKEFRKNQKIVQGRFTTLGSEQSISVKTVQTTSEFNYYRDQDMQMVGMETQDNQLTVYIILPKRRHGLHQLEKQRLQYGKQLQQLIELCDSTKQTMRIQLPIFQVAHKMDIKQMLRKMGLEDAFDGDQADFGGILDENEQEEHLLKYGRRQTGGLEDIDSRKATKYHQQKTRLYLNKIIELANIQVNEQGVNAASATDQQQQYGKATKSKSSEMDETEKEANDFNVDHAFAFLVKHNPSNQLLLIGRIVDPTQPTERDRSQFSDTEAE